MRRYLIPAVLAFLAPGVALAQTTAVRPGRVRVVTTGDTDTASVADLGGWIEWRSSAAGEKTQILPPCDAPSNGFPIGVADGQGNAATYDIHVQAASGQALSVGNVAISSNGGALQFVCNGAGSWIAAGQFAGGEVAPHVITDITVNPDTFVADGTIKNVGTLAASMNRGSFTGSFSISPEAGNNPGNMFAVSGINLRANGNATQGTHTVTIRATQADASPPTHDVPLTVTGTGPLPVITSATTANVAEGQPFSYEIRANCQGTTCAGANAITAFNVTTQIPEGLSQSGPLGQYISGTVPATNVFNRWSIALNAVNANGAGHATLTLNVSPP